MTTIIVTHEDNEVDEFEFEPTQRVISVGRRSSNDVCIADLSVSGNHAKITFQDGHAWLEDLNSTNGTYVNGQVIFRHSVGNDDDIMMGKIKLALLTDAVKDAAANIDAERERANYTGARFRPEPDDEPIEPGVIVHDDAQHYPDMTEAGVEPHLIDGSFSNDSDTNTGSDSQFANDTQYNRSANGSDMNIGAGTHSNTSDRPLDETQHPLDGLEHLVVPPDQPTLTPTHELDKPGNISNGAVIEIKNGAKSGQILPIDKPVTTLGRPGIQIAAIMRKPDGYFLMHIESDESVDRPTLNRDAIGDEPVLLHSGDELNVAGIDVEFMLS
ncbi:MAG: FHA domain-containing protein [Granulosicoccus sp.]|nr:FHA domain-containing protein [Granulosicoccus sp.]